MKMNLIAFHVQLVFLAMVLIWLAIVNLGSSLRIINVPKKNASKMIQRIVMDQVRKFHVPYFMGTVQLPVIIYNYFLV